MIFKAKYEGLRWRKCILKCSLQKIGHNVSPSVRLPWRVVYLLKHAECFCQQMSCWFPKYILCKMIMQKKYYRIIYKGNALARLCSFNRHRKFRPGVLDVTCPFWEFWWNWPYYSGTLIDCMSACHNKPLGNCCTNPAETLIKAGSAIIHSAAVLTLVVTVYHHKSDYDMWPLLLTCFDFNPSMDM